MATLTGLFQRGTAYYLCIVLPPQHPLRSSYKNGKLMSGASRCLSQRTFLRNDGRFLRAATSVFNAGGAEKRLPKQDIQCSATHFQCMRSMVVSDGSVGLCLPCIASVVKQGCLPMVLDSLLQLNSSFTMEELRSDYRLPRNWCVGKGHGATLYGCWQIIFIHQ